MNSIRLLLILVVATLIQVPCLAQPGNTQNTGAPAAMTQETKDVLYLKNGSIIKGTIVEMIPDSTIRIQTADGSLFVYSMREVEKVLKEEVPTISRLSSTVEPVDRPRRKTQLSPLVGYGTLDGYNFGFGIRIGSTSPSGVYFGGTFVYHLGKSEELSYGYGFGNISIKVTANCFYLGPEIGYDARPTENVMMRPYMGFGYFSMMASAEAYGNRATNSEARFYMAPGVMLGAFASQQAMIGIDARYVIVTGTAGSSANSFGIFMALGIFL